MARQFEKVNARYGAPFGRAEYGSYPTNKLRLFRVKINAGGYDDGGAYWGHGAPLWCATNGTDYCRFARAGSRLEACVALSIFADELAVPPKKEYLTLDHLARCGALGAAGVKLRQELDLLGFDRYAVAAELRSGFKP